MTISADIITDSISPAGIRLTTFQLRYPRFIHAEFMTHRVFSRNASSSRAIPVNKMIEDLRRDPAMPIYWGSNQKGMQAGAELCGADIQELRSAWLVAMDNAILSAQGMVEFGLHKQIANRILEPWAHINIVVTATDWENFYTLRRHKDAQPEIKMLADLMWEAQQESYVNELQPGQWHLPYYKTEDALTLRNYYRDVRVPLGDDLKHFLNREIKDQEPTIGWAIEAAKKISVARCARVSYLTHDGRQTTIEEDLQLYDRLLGSQPLHASPAEHQATPDSRSTEEECEHIHFTQSGAEKDMPCGRWDNATLHGNLTGWIQYRKTLPEEFIPG